MEGVRTEQGRSERRQLTVDVLRRVGRNLAYLVGGKAFSAVLGLGYLALTVRGLGVIGFGQLALIYSFCVTIATLTKFQTWQPILHYGTTAFAEGRTADLHRLVAFTVLLDLASSGVGAILACGSIWVLGSWIGLDPRVLPDASLFGISVLFMTTSTSNGLLRMFDRFDLLLVEDNIEAGVRFLGCVVLYLAGAGLGAFLVVWFLSVLASAATCAGLAWQEYRRRVPSKGVPDLWRRTLIHRGSNLTAGFPGLWKFVWSTNANSSLGLVSNQIATLVLGGLLGPAGAGLFRIGRQIADAVGKPVKMIVPVFYPELARLVACRQFELMRRINRRVTMFSSAGAAAGMLFLALAGQWLLLLIGGHAAVAAYGVMLLLSAAALIRIGTFTLEPTLVSLGRPHTVFWIQLASAAVFLPALIGLVHMVGVLGAGLAVVMSAAIAALLQHFAVSASYRTPLTLAESQA